MRILITLKQRFYAPRKHFGGAYCRCCVRPSVRPSSYLLNHSSEIDVVDFKCSFRLGLVDQGHFEKFRVTQSIYYKNPILTFLRITVKDTDMKSSETYTGCYRQYVQYIRYGPWGQPHFQQVGNC
jgi:hypothetical protein